MVRAEGLGHAGDVGADLEATLLAHLRQARDARAVLVDEVDHVGVAVPTEAQQERLRERTDHPLHQVPPPAILRVVEVHHEAATDVDQQHRVLALVGDAQHPHAVGDPHPRPVGQHLDAVAVTAELAGDPAADVVGQQDAGVAEQREGRRVQVVGVPVREPHRARGADGHVLGRRDLVREPPTAEIGRTAHPRIGREHGLAVVHDDRRVPDGLEAELHRQHSRVCAIPHPGTAVPPNVVQRSVRRRDELPS